MSDDKGVLGNLPRSRPGTRSDKRGADSASRPAKAAERAAERSERSGSAARTAAPKGTRPRAPKRPATPPKPQAKAQAGDPVADAARVAAKALGTGVRIGAGVAQEVLRRLPRP